MRQSVVLATPPADEPVTVAEAKAWARIDTSDDDAFIAQLITAARVSAEEYTRRSFMTQTWKLSLDMKSSGIELGDGVYELPQSILYGTLPTEVKLPKGPVQSIASVVTYDVNDNASTMPPSDYRVDQDRMILGYGASWPTSLRPNTAAEITYVAGYGTANAVPQPIKTAIIIHAAALYEERGMCDGTIPAAAARLLNQYRIL